MMTANGRAVVLAIAVAIAVVLSSLSGCAIAEAQHGVEESPLLLGGESFQWERTHSFLLNFPHSRIAEEIRGDNDEGDAAASAADVVVADEVGDDEDEGDAPEEEDDDDGNAAVGTSPKPTPPADQGEGLEQNDGDAENEEGEEAGKDVGVANPFTSTLEKAEECRFELSGESGLFSSPNFPEDYPSNSNCSWYIQAPEGKRVRLTIHLMQVEYNRECIWDWVRIYDVAVDGSETLLKHVCGYLQQDLVLESSSASGALRLQFFAESTIAASGFLASWRVVVDGEVADAGGAGEEGYLLALPQAFVTSNETEPEEVCLQLFNVASAGSVDVSFFATTQLLSGDPGASLTFGHAGGGGDGGGDSPVQCQSVKLDSAAFPGGSAVVRVKAKFPNGYSILSFKAVRLINLRPMMLIQTDKPDYRPEQVVKFRVLALDYQLRPSSLVRVLPEAWIASPSGSRIRQWKDVDVVKGMAQLEHALGEEPELGTWKVNVRYSASRTESAAKFTVSESAMPKFEVRDGAEGGNPAHVVRGAANTTFAYCAAYTHGRRVGGTLNVTFSSIYRPLQWGALPRKVEVAPLGVELDPETGCAAVSINATQIAALSENTLSFLANAVVTEEGTGIQQRKTDKIKVKSTPFEMVLGRGSSSTSGSHSVSTASGAAAFPVLQELLLREHDSVTPVAGEPVLVCASLYTSIHALREEVGAQTHLLYTFSEEQYIQLAEDILKIRHREVCQRLTSDSTGRVAVAIPLSDVPANVTRLSLRATATERAENVTAGIKRPTAKLDIELSRTNATSALSITADLGHPALNCGDNSVRVYLSAPASSAVRLSHYVSSGGALLRGQETTIEVGEGEGSDGMRQFIAQLGPGVVTLDGLGQTDDATGRSGDSQVLVATDIKLNRPFADEGQVAKYVSLLVHARGADGHGLAATTKFLAESCSPIPLIKFSKDRARPGDALQMTLKSTPDSLCGYSLVDKSVDLLANPNRVTTSRVQAVKEAVAKRRVVADKSRGGTGCKNADLLFQAFERMGLFVLSDQLLIDTKCDNLVDVTNNKQREEDDLPEPPLYESIPHSSPPLATPPPPLLPPLTTTTSRPSHGGDVDYDDLASDEDQEELEDAGLDNPIELRDYFPETWLFDLIELDSDGEAHLNTTAPHTITTWVAEAICTNDEVSLGISNATSLPVSQDFFVDVSAPFSAKRGEVLPVNVTVFSNVNRALPLRVSIEKSEDFELVGEAERQVCLGVKDSTLNVFQIRAVTLGDVNITTTATVTAAAGAESACNSTETDEGSKDAVVKTVRVKPEGIPKETVQSLFQCLHEEVTMQTMLEPLTLPSQIVGGSERGWMRVSGDVMAPSLSHLERLLNVPTGCGEQNMIGMAPNVYLLDYMAGTRRSEPEIESKAREFIEKGYQRQMRFRHSNGAYSVWGPDDQDAEGSLWLTAFVVKVFAQASSYMEIHAETLRQSIDFILNQQEESGCFANSGFVLHPELGGTNVSVTASTLIALLEARKQFVQLHSEHFRRAAECIQSNQTDELYTKSLSAYALNVYSEMFGDPSAKESATILTDELLDMANKTLTGGRLYWHDAASKSRSVEMTAYNILSLVLQDRLPEALSAVRWLATQRNAFGGFVSTQDTVVALQALSQYSIRVDGLGTQLTVRAVEEASAEEHVFRIDGDNSLVQQSQKLASLPTNLSVEIGGEGCYILQTVLRYNEPVAPKQKSFLLRAWQSAGDGMVSICATYTGPKADTGMVMVELELLSGFAAVPASIEALKAAEGVKKVESDREEGSVAIYLDRLGRDETCWQLRVKREAAVEDLKPAQVKVYEYYNAENSQTTLYSIQEGEDSKDEKASS